MRVAVLGGTGFVGSYLVDELLSSGHALSAMVRAGSEHRLPQGERCETVTGDVADPFAVRKTLENCQAVIYNIGILREFPERGITYDALHFEGARRAMDIAVEQGARRFLLMSANGVRADGTPYQKTKYLAEQYLQTTELEWTVFRPSVIFGDPGGRMEFATQLRDQVVRSPLPAPLFFDGLLPLKAGSFRLAPIHVRDVAAVFAKALEMPHTGHRIYRLCGPQALEWATILQTIAHACGREKWALPAPAWAVKLASTVFDRFEFFPITRDQITMLMEGNTCEGEDSLEEFGVQPTPFDEVYLEYLRN
jgi:uncharacterized protein YbjT (DUF2867 family)